MNLYKVLNEDGSTRNGGSGCWPLPTNGLPGEWLHIGDGELSPCLYGLHLCRKQDLVYWLGPAIWTTEYRGEILRDKDKVVVREARLLERVETWNDTTARLFAADCAERALLRWRKAGRDPDERSWAAVRAARQYARGEIGGAKLSAAWDAAGDADRAAAVDDAWDAAGDAAWDAAWDAAGDADRAAAVDDAWVAERRWQTRRLFEYLNGVRK